MTFWASPLVFWPLHETCLLTETCNSLLFWCCAIRLARCFHIHYATGLHTLERMPSVEPGSLTSSQVVLLSRSHGLEGGEAFWLQSCALSRAHYSLRNPELMLEYPSKNSLTTFGIPLVEVWRALRDLVQKGLVRTIYSFATQSVGHRPATPGSLL